MYSYITIIGRATADAEVRYTQSGKGIRNLNIAVNRKEKDGEHTDFFKVTDFLREGQQPPFPITKGALVLAAGDFKMGSYTNKQGALVTYPEVVAKTIRVLSAKNATPAQSGAEPPPTSASLEKDVWAGDIGPEIPF